MISAPFSLLTEIYLTFRSLCAIVSPSSEFHLNLSSRLLPPHTSLSLLALHSALSFFHSSSFYFFVLPYFPSLLFPIPIIFFLFIPFSPSSFFLSSSFLVVFLMFFYLSFFFPPLFSFSFFLSSSHYLDADGLSLCQGNVNKCG